MRKLFYLILCSIIFISLAGCSDSSDEKIVITTKSSDDNKEIQQTEEVEILEIHNLYENGEIKKEFVEANSLILNGRVVFSMDGAHLMDMSTGASVTLFSTDIQLINYSGINVNVLGYFDSYGDFTVDRLEITDSIFSIDSIPKDYRGLDGKAVVLNVFCIAWGTSPEVQDIADDNNAYNEEIQTLPVIDDNNLIPTDNFYANMRGKLVVLGNSLYFQLEELYPIEEDFYR